MLGQLQLRVCGQDWKHERGCHQAAGEVLGAVPSPSILDFLKPTIRFLGPTPIDLAKSARSEFEHFLASFTASASSSRTVSAGCSRAEILSHRATGNDDSLQCDRFTHRPVPTRPARSASDRCGVQSMAQITEQWRLAIACTSPRAARGLKFFLSTAPILLGRRIRMAHQDGIGRNCWIE